MDFATARASLPGLTRAAFGEDVTLLAMVAGELGGRPDGSRANQEAVRARYDIDPGTEQLGDRREAKNRVFGTLARATFSIERTALSWLPREGDIVRRANGDRFRVDAVNGDQPGLVILYVSKVKS